MTADRNLDLIGIEEMDSGYDPDAEAHSRRVMEIWQKANPGIDPGVDLGIGGVALKTEVDINMELKIAADSGVQLITDPVDPVVDKPTNKVMLSQAGVSDSDIVEIPAAPYEAQILNEDGAPIADQSGSYRRRRKNRFGGGVDNKFRGTK